MKTRLYQQYENKRLCVKLLAVFLSFLFIFYDLFLFTKLNMLVQESKTFQSPKQNYDYSILIDIEERKLFLLKSGNCFREYSCAVGKSETPSPTGSFRITEKSHWGEGFGGYWLGLNCSWGCFGIHGTKSPESIGLPSSHGCFRMQNEDAAELYSYAKIGTPVYVYIGCYGIFGNGFRTIEPYMYGQDIKAIQLKLKEKGYYFGMCDGKYDSETMKRAVHKFQQANNLPVSDNISSDCYKALGFTLIE